MDSITDFYNSDEYIDILKGYIMPKYKKIVETVNENLSYSFNTYNYKKLEQIIVSNYYTYLGISISIILIMMILICYLINDIIKDKKKNIDIKNKKYIESINEVNENNNIIINKLKSNTDYFVLIRVKLNNPIKMKKTKYDINENKGKDFETDNFCVIFGFHTLDIDKTKNYINIANLISGMLENMNYMKNHKIKDFIIVAIGTNNLKYNDNRKINSEFFGGMININYELFNIKMLDIKTSCGNILRFIMLLPIYEINNLFFDIYNDIIYESKKYKIDKNNYETWNNKPLRKLKKD